MYAVQSLGLDPLQMSSFVVFVSNKNFYRLVRFRGYGGRDEQVVCVAGKGEIVILSGGLQKNLKSNRSRFVEVYHQICSYYYSQEDLSMNAYVDNKRTYFLLSFQE
ncbi:hypothetical protein OPV22_029966 [Ensete ventricosum]|uniref:Uncharacterized protein n=1 Tax=Ensete ventricosum TaxID=4639 RepID=A0AAV8Q7G0_ENSVE|nr:hypothetical protein OPV22_029966 [Ensete ventricosum]